VNGRAGQIALPETFDSLNGAVPIWRVEKRLRTELRLLACHERCHGNQI